MIKNDSLQNADGQPQVNKLNNPEVESNVITSETASRTDNQDDVIEEIDNSNAEESEDNSNIDEHRIPEQDYTNMSLEELLSTLEKLNKNEKPHTIKKHVSDLKDTFWTKYNELVDEKKEQFINDGGNEIDFYYNSPIEKQFKSLYKDYRSKVTAHYKSIEANLKANLKIRQNIIEQIKNLINVEEDINTTYNTFKDLQKQWRNTGSVPRENYKDTWNNYHHHIERFYDFLSLNRELRDKDFKENLKLKIGLIEDAEALLKLDDVHEAFRKLQILHKDWKEELGPVAPEHRELIWDRFKAITKAIHDKRKVYFDALEDTYKDNLIVKNDIINKIEVINTNLPKNHGGWQKQIKKIEELRQAFFAAGKVPLKDSESIKQKLRHSVRKFNRQKNQYYKNLKKEQYNNLQKKLELVTIAETNKDSDDFEVVTPLMKKIQSDWKNIGHVPHKESDIIWKRFKSACNHYFNKFHESKNKESEVETEAFKLKTDILNQLSAFKPSGDKKSDLDAIQKHIDKWQELGKVSKNKRYIEGKLQKTLSSLFKTIGVEPKKAELIKYDNKLEYLNRKDDDDSLDKEHYFIRKKIDETKSSINQLENNLQFFTNVDKSNPLVKDVFVKIDKEKEELELWKAKLSKLKSF